MARPRKKIIQRATPSKPTERLARALGKYRKAELVEFLVDLAEDDGAVMRHLESVVDLDKPS